MSKKRKYRKLKPSVPNYWWYAIADGWLQESKKIGGRSKATILCMKMTIS